MLNPFPSTFWSRTTLQDLLASTVGLFVIVLVFAVMAIQSSPGPSVLILDAENQFEVGGEQQIVIRTFSGR